MTITHVNQAFIELSLVFLVPPDSSIKKQPPPRLGTIKTFHQDSLIDLQVQECLVTFFKTEFFHF